ncbi:hypothetical protein ACWDUD_26965 [Rhodococcus sp. NPDC003382]
MSDPGSGTSRAVTGWTYGLLFVAIAACGVIVSGLLRDPEPELTTTPPTTTTAAPAAAEEYTYVTEPVTYPTTIPGCESVEPPGDDAGFLSFSGSDFGYDNPAYPWFSGPKAVAMTDAVVRALPDDADMVFASPRQSLLFGPILDPSFENDADRARFGGFTTAYATIRRDEDAGALSLSVRASTTPVPPCVAGRLDERRVLDDGTVVDVNDTWSETNGVRTVFRSAQAYAPDGSEISAHIDDTDSTTGDAVHSGHPPLTVDELVALVSVPELRVSAPVPPGTPTVPESCSSPSDSDPIDAATAARLDGVLAGIPVADLAVDSPLGELRPAGFDGAGLCQAVRVTTPGSESTLTVAVAAGQPRPSATPDDEAPTPTTGSGFVETRELPDGTVIQRREYILTTQGLAAGSVPVTSTTRTVTVTRPSGTRVDVTSRADIPDEPLPMERLEQIASTPGLEV